MIFHLFDGYIFVPEVAFASLEAVEQVSDIDSLEDVFAVDKHGAYLNYANGTRKLEKGDRIGWLDDEGIIGSLLRREVSLDFSPQRKKGLDDAISNLRTKYTVLMKALERFEHGPNVVLLFDEKLISRDDYVRHLQMSAQAEEVHSGITILNLLLDPSISDGAKVLDGAYVDVKIAPANTNLGFHEIKTIRGGAVEKARDLGTSLGLEDGRSGAYCYLFDAKGDLRPSTFLYPTNTADLQEALGRENDFQLTLDEQEAFKEAYKASYRETLVATHKARGAHKCREPWEDEE